MHTISYYLLFIIAYCFSLLPFWILYRVSDFFGSLLRILKYRNHVILTNLRNSFPDKTEQEILTIRNLYYKHLCDLFVETIKLLSISLKNIQKRVEIENLYIINNAFRKNKNVIAVLGHYNNWEWVPVINTYMSAQGCAAFHPLKSKTMDRFMIKIRSVFSSYNIPHKSTKWEILRMKRHNKNYVLGLISDQSPGFISIQYTLPFLNQNTPVLLGAEKLSKLTNDLVVYFNMDKTKRGHYKLSIIPITDNPKETKTYEITQKHVKLLEKQIINQPQYWLWSHRRWKFANMTKDDFEKQQKN